MRPTSKYGILVLAVAVVATAIAAGCATSAPLRTEASASGIRAAEELGASSVPRAALHLELARQELDQARGLAKEGEKDRAASMLLRADADAELAVLLSREETEKSDALAAVARVRQLRQDNQ
jgi:hypothetical protein